MKAEIRRFSQGVPKPHASKAFRNMEMTSERISFQEICCYVSKWASVLGLGLACQAKAIVHVVI